MPRNANEVYRGSFSSVSVGVHIGRFYNVGIYEAGTYSIRIRVYTKSPKSIGGVKRTDGIVTETIENGNARSGEKESKVSSYLACQRVHANRIDCNWRCRPKYLPVKAKNRFAQLALWAEPPKIWASVPLKPDTVTTPPITIIHQDEIVDINTAYMFDILINDYKNSSKHHDCAYLELSLYFGEGHLAALKQTRTLRLNHFLSKQFHEPVYHPLQFYGVCGSLCDLTISRCLTGLQPIFKSAKPNDIKSTPQSPLSVIGAETVFNWISGITPKRTQSDDDSSDLGSSGSQDITEPNLEVLEQGRLKRDMCMLLASLLELLSTLSYNGTARSITYGTVWGILITCFKTDLDQSDIPEADVSICKMLERGGSLLDIFKTFVNGPKDIQVVTFLTAIHSLSLIISNAFKEYIAYQKANCNMGEMMLLERRAYRTILLQHVVTNGMPVDHEKGAVTGKQIADKKSPPVQQYPKPMPPTAIKKIFIAEGKYASGEVTVDLVPETNRCQKRLFVFVHGLQGFSTDLLGHRNSQYLEAQIFEANPKYVALLVSKANENDSMNDISTMGRLLAIEIFKFIKEADYGIESISFVCHSLGGLIARSAITQPPIQQFKHKLGLLCTFGTPHASLFQSSNTIINTCIIYANTSSDIVPIRLRQQN